MADSAPPATQVTENGTSAAQVETAPEFKVFVGNLAYSTTDEGLRAFFAPVEKDIVSVQLILRGTRPAGYGFLQLKTQEAANQVVETFNQKELDGRPLAVEIAKPAEQKEKEKKERKPKRRTDAVKTEDGAAAAGTDEAAKPKKKKKKAARKPKAPKPEGEGAEGAAPAEGDTEDKKQPRPRKARAARPARPAGEDPEGEPSKNMLFVANLGFNIDDAGLAALFTEAGIKVVSARVVRRSWGRPRRSKGYGFVDVGDEEEQKKAIAALEGKDVGGRPIAVKIAVNTPQEEGEAAPAAPVADDAASAVVPPATA